MINVSSSNSQAENVPKLRFPGFEGEYKSTCIGDVFDERSERGGQNLELLSVTMNDGVIKRAEIEGKDNSSDDKSNYKIVRKGDMVYNSMRMWQGANGISLYDGIVSPAYTVLQAKQPIIRGYFAALFKNSGIINEFRKSSQGLTSDTWNLKYPQIAPIKICIPSISEQRRVSHFLETFDKRIQKQRRLVEALKSYKRGLATSLFNRNIRMTRDDGTPYFEWKKRALGEVFSERTEKAKGDEKLLAVTINNGILNRADLELKDNSSDDKTNYRVVYIDDLAYNSMRMWQGACGVSAYNGIVSPAYTVVYVTNSVTDYTPFWGHYFKEASMLHLFQRNSQGLTSDTWNLKYDKFSQIAVISPTKEEQVRIASLLDYLTGIIANQEESLSKMQTYKRGLLEKIFI